MADITAAPADLHLTRKDKTLTLRMRPLTDRDITELEQWLKSNVIRIAQSSIDSDTLDVIAELTMRVAISKSLSMTFSSLDGRTALGSLTGMSRIVWQCTRRDHPEVSEQDIREYLLDAESIIEFNRVFDLLNTHPDDATGDATGNSGGGTPAKG